jgi:hypothetical protein
MRTSKLPLPALGIDIGRVVMCPADDDGAPDTSFLQLPEAQALEVPASPCLWDVLPAIVDAFERRVWLVSKAGARIGALTRRWLAHHRFFERVGMAPDAARFCRKRPEKRDHAVALGLTHFVDDRVDVLEALRGAVPRLYLFGAQARPAPAFAIHVPDWIAASDALLGDLARLEELRRHVIDEPHAVGRAREGVPGLGKGGGAHG